MNNKLPVILDVDTGIDDAVALITACAQKELDIKLITCCFGNTTLKNSVTNTLTVLELLNRTDIPVCAGEAKAINSNLKHISAHGINGLGGFTKSISTKPLSVNYIDKMHEIVLSNPLTYIIVCGPYTNIAKYIKTYPQDINKIKLIAVTASNYIDKKNPYLNFNIHIDIDSFKYVLNNIPNIVFCTSDMGHKAYISSSEIYKSAKYGEIGKFLSTIYPYHKDRTVKDGVALHDACGIAWLTNPKMFKINYAKAKFKISKSGIEYLDINYTSKKPNIIITTDINIKKFHKWYYKSLKILNK
jgi:inosine-uridine nucleoside N-ribohydrolase